MSSEGLDLHLMRLVDAIEEKPVPVAVWAEGMRPDVFDTLTTAAKAGWMKPVLFGTEANLQRLIGSEESVDSIDINTWDDEADALAAMFQLASLGSVKALAFAPADARSTWQKISSLDASPFQQGTSAFGIAMMVPEMLNRPLFLTDAVVHAEPTPGDRIAMMPKVVKALQKLGLIEPRIALLTAVEVASPGLPATMEAQEVAAAFEKQEGWYVQGPLSMDLAVSEHAAKKKKAQGEVPGKADLLAAPNLTVARGVLQALTTLSDTPAASVLLGGPVPTALPDALDGGVGLVRSIALACAVSCA